MQYFGPGFESGEVQRSVFSGQTSVRNEQVHPRDSVAQLGRGGQSPVQSAKNGKTLGALNEDAALALSQQNKLLKAQKSQLERQVICLEKEISARADLVSEAEASLAGIAAYLEGVLDAGGDASQQLQQREVRQWSQQMLQRMQRCRALPRATPEADPGPASGIGSALSGAPSLLQDPHLLHRLEEKLYGLSAELGSLALRLRSSVLPAMEFLDDRLAADLEVQVSAAAAGSVSVMRELADVTAGLRGGRGLHGDSAADAVEHKASVHRETQRFSQCSGLLRELAELDLEAEPRTALTLPTAEEVLQALPQPAKMPEAGRRVIQQLMERVASREAVQAMRQQVLESELAWLSRVQAQQAEQWRALLRACEGAEHAFRSERREARSAAGKAAESLLKAGRNLLREPSETNLKKMVNTLSAHMDAFADVPRLLDGQRSELGAESSSSGGCMGSLERRYAEALSSLRRDQARRRRELVEEARRRVAALPDQEPWESEAAHPRQRLRAEQEGWRDSLRGASPARGFSGRDRRGPSEPRQRGIAPASSGRGLGTPPMPREPMASAAAARTPTPEATRPPFDLSFLTPGAAKAAEAGEKAAPGTKQRKKKALEDRPPFTLEFSGAPDDTGSARGDADRL